MDEPVVYRMLSIGGASLKWRRLDDSIRRSFSSVFASSSIAEAPGTAATTLGAEFLFPNRFALERRSG